MRFAIRCMKHPKFKNLFPLSEPDPYNFRSVDKYEVKFARTDHYRDSSIPYLKRKLNDEHRNKNVNS